MAWDNPEIKIPDSQKYISIWAPQSTTDNSKTYFNLSPSDFFSKDYKTLWLKITEDQYATRIEIPGVWTPLNIYKDTWNVRIYLDTPDDQKKVLYLLQIWALGSSIADHPVMQKARIESQQNNEAQKFIESRNSDSPPSFPSSDIIDTRWNKPKIVLQHSQEIIKQPKEWEWIYTFWAWPCAIVTITDKTTWQIWLAHFDAGNIESQIRSFVTSAWFSDPEIHILSWERDLMYKVVQAIPDKNTIETMNADLRWDRSDAAWVFIQNWKPTIVYWLRQDWLPKLN